MGVGYLEKFTFLQCKHHLYCILFLISRLLMARKLEVDHQTSSEGPQVSYSSGTVHGKPPVLWFFRDNNPHCVFSSGPFHNTVWSKERTLLNIQNNIEHTLRLMYSPLVSSVTRAEKQNTFYQGVGGSSTMVRMYVCNKDIRCNLFFRALPQHQSGARKTDYKTLQNCLELRL